MVQNSVKSFPHVKNNIAITLSPLLKHDLPDLESLRRLISAGWPSLYHLLSFIYETLSLPNVSSTTLSNSFRLLPHVEWTLPPTTSEVIYLHQDLSPAKVMVKDNRHISITTFTPRKNSWGKASYVGCKTDGWMTD